MKNPKSSVSAAMVPAPGRPAVEADRAVPLPHSLPAMVDIAVRKLSFDVRELSLGTSGEIERISGPPSPLRFLRDFVTPSKPCIISHAIDHWPALRLWSNSYLCSVLERHVVSVHFTPDGFADAVVDLDRLSSMYGCSVANSGCTFCPSGSGIPNEHFVSVLDGAAGVADGREAFLPNNRGPAVSTEQRQYELWFATSHVERLPFPAALNLILRSGTENGEVAYAQHQNDCFVSEYGILAADVESHLPWATEALGCLPEAVNLWIGNASAVTSFHKDHYENLYAVIAGEKHFTLLPPTDVHRLYLRHYPAAHYSRQFAKC